MLLISVEQQSQCDAVIIRQIINNSMRIRCNSPAIVLNVETYVSNRMPNGIMNMKTRVKHV